MKKLKSLNLHHLGQAEMTKKEMNALTGGYDLGNVCVCGCPCTCPTATCGCKYAGEQEGPNDPYYGGSSSSDNSNANTGQSKTSTAESSGGRDGSALTNKPYDY